MKLITVGKYLLNRLTEIGVKTLFGVPGDFNLEFLDLVLEKEGLSWVGNTNELNAAYSADGYARLNGIGAFLTTFGVGELSAINGVAGSYSEDVPVIHIVGAPKRSEVEKQLLLHHTLGTGKDFDTFKSMYEKITKDAVWLDHKNAANQIDSAIRNAVFYKKPVYIMLPVDVSKIEIVDNEKPLSFSSSFDDKENMQIIDDIVAKIENSKHAVIISGHKVLRYGLVDDVEKLANNLNVNVTTTPFGKSSFNESNSLFLGTYSGEKSLDESIPKFINNADLILIIGNKFTDITSSFFNLKFDQSAVVEITDTYVKYDDKVFTNHSFGLLIKTLANKKIKYSGLSILSDSKYESFYPTDKEITYDRFTLALNDYLYEDDILVSDLGTCSFAVQYLKLKKNISFLMQPLWASIGFSFPASIGAKIASNNRRVINIIGDGAFNMTFNEIATAISKNIAITTFVINNQGYTIERIIHGPEQKYNDIPYTSYVDLVKAFDPNQVNSITYKVTNEIELYKALQQTLGINNKFILIEVCIDKFEAPSFLKSGLFK